MDMTPEEPNLIHVELVCPMIEPPISTEATLASLEHRQCAVWIDSPIPTLAPETSVVLRLRQHRALDIFGLVDRHEGQNIDVRIVRVSQREKRYFPRENGGIDMRWKRLEGPGLEAAVQAWRRGLFEVDGDAEWNVPEPFMNFSASGFRFRDRGETAPGDTLLVTFRPHGQTAWHRVTATVVRRTPAEDGGPAEIALAFDDIDPSSVEALADFTLDRQLIELARHGVQFD